MIMLMIVPSSRQPKTHTQPKQAGEQVDFVAFPAVRLCFSHFNRSLEVKEVMICRFLSWEGGEGSGRK